MMRRAFTLVEVMIAVVLSTIIGIFLMNMLTRFTVDTTRIGSQGHAAREVSRILSVVKSAIREARAVNGGEGTLSLELHGGGSSRIDFEPGRNVLNVEQGGKVNPMGAGSVFGFEVAKASEKIPGLYRIRLLYENPRNPEKATIDNALAYEALAAQRAPMDLDTKYWVPNQKSLPGGSAE